MVHYTQIIALKYRCSSILDAETNVHLIRNRYLSLSNIQTTAIMMMYHNHSEREIPSKFLNKQPISQNEYLK